MCKQFGITIIKGVTCLANIVLLASGCGILTTTLMNYQQFKSYHEILDSSMQTIPLLGIVLASIILTTVMFGFLGMLLNAFGMICFFVTLMFLLGLASVIIGIYVHAEAKEMQSNAQYFLNRLDQSPNITQDTEAMISINAMQIDLMCCGFNEGKYQYFNESSALPASCCKDPSTTCFGDDIWEDNCLLKLEIFGVVANSELGTLLLCMGAQCVMVGAIGYVLAMAVRQYYYY